MSYNLTWEEAEILARSGSQVRQYDWRKWLYCDAGVFYIVEGSSRHVVRAPEFQRLQFTDRTWTDEPWEGEDICERPGPLAPVVMPQPVCGCPKVCPLTKDQLWKAWREQEWEKLEEHFPELSIPGAEWTKGCLCFVWVCRCHGEIKAWQTIGLVQSDAHLAAVLGFVTEDREYFFAISFFGFRTHALNPAYEGDPDNEQKWLRTFYGSNKAWILYLWINSPD